jgi:pyrroloquinoline quinone biosynthesis protein B
VGKPSVACLCFVVSTVLRAIAWIAAAWLAGACRALAPEAGAPGPYVVVLGTAQDGGLPQLGCHAPPCEAARRDPLRRRRVTSLLLCDPRDGRRWLLDCTPDVEEQLALAQGHPATRSVTGPRPPLFEGLFLTHAHMGHYGGLLELGREAYAVSEVPTFVTPRFASFLRANAPWSLLVEERRLLLREISDGVPIELAPDLLVVPFLVPHRDEFSDTVGFWIRGPKRALAYLPDIDKWEAWDAFPASASGPNAARKQRIEALLESSDLALLDGAFFADGEIPGRSLKDIPHPFLSESIARFATLPAATRAKVHFTHLNHTNPAAEEHSSAWNAVRDAGMSILREGARFEL